MNIYIDKTKQAWDELASWWDAEVQDGDEFHRTFIYPSILQLSHIKATDKILDIGCGNGSLSRLLAKSGANIVATDFSAKMIDCAKKRSSNYQNLSFFTLDATNAHELAILANQQQFDLIVCSMAMHDMWTIEPLSASLSKLLVSGGKFIFSIPHPCFNAELVKFNLDQAEKSSITISKYINAREEITKAKSNQPITHYSYHRPLSMIFNLLIKAGLILQQLAEPIDTEHLLPSKVIWSTLNDIPPVIVSSWSK